MALFAYAFLTVWFLSVVIGLIRPQLYLPLLKWNMRTFGRMYGFRVEPISDAEVCRKLRLWYCCFFAFGILLVFLLLRVDGAP